MTHDTLKRRLDVLAATIVARQRTEAEHMLWCPPADAGLQGLANAYIRNLTGYGRPGETAEAIQERFMARYQALYEAAQAEQRQGV